MKQTFLKSFLFAFTLLSISTFTRAENDYSDPKVLYKDSLEAMKASDWEGALKILSKGTGSYTTDAAYNRFGPKFGYFWYNKGFCEEQLKKYDEAQVSYLKCYEKFPNSENGDSKNNFHTYALYKLGGVSFKQKDYAQCLTYYDKFTKEKSENPKSKDAKYDKAKFYINSAISKFKTNDLKGGNKDLKLAIDQKKVFRTQPSSVFEGFNALSELAIKEKNEQAILSFLKDYRSELLLDSYVTGQFSKLLLTRASAAIKADMKAAPMELVSLIPNTRSTINDLNAILSSFDGYTSKSPLRDGYKVISVPGTQKLVEKLKSEEKGAESNESFKLALSGYLWTSAGNMRAAYAAYKELESRYENSKNRESNLFNLILTAQGVGKPLEAEQHGKTFLRVFPKAEKAGDVQKIMLSGLYANKQYSDALRLAEAQLNELEASKPSLAHDACLFVLGGSLHYTGKYSMASKYLAQHAKEYPDSKHNEEAMFLDASSYSRLQQWQEAGSKLDGFLAKYKGKKAAFTPYALFDRANCYFATQELDKAMEVLSTLESDYPSNSLIDVAYNLKGSIYYSREDEAKAEEYYKKGFEAAKAKANKGVAGESLYSLIALLASPERKDDRSKDALSYYDQYWESYADGSPYQAQVAVAGFPLMEKAGRADEGLEKMKSVISAVAKLPGQPRLEALINSYRNAYLEVNNADQLKEHFYTFDGINAEDREALALLRISLIGAYEDEIKEAKKAKDSAQAKKLTANVKVLFNDLKNDFEPKMLTPFSLIKIGDYIRTKTSTSAEAVAYYKEVIERKDEKFRLPALFGLADLYAVSSKPNEKATAKQYLLDIYGDEKGKKSDRENALFRLIELHMANGEWVEANTRALEYNQNKSFRKFSAKAAYLYAQSFDKQGKDAEALVAYVKVQGSNLGYIQISAPATKRMIELFWKRAKSKVVSEDGVVTTEGDRQAAYNQGWKYLDLTKRNFTKMTDGDKALWKEVEATVKKYEQSGEVKDMATQIAEKKKK